MKAAKKDANIRQGVAGMGKDSVDSEQKGEMELPTSTGGEVERKRVERKAVKQDKKAAKKDADARKQATESGVKNGSAVTEQTDANGQKGKRNEGDGAKPNQESFVEQDRDTKNLEGSPKGVIIAKKRAERKATKDGKGAEHKESKTGDFESDGKDDMASEPKAAKEEAYEHKKEVNATKVEVKRTALKLRLVHKTEKADTKEAEEADKKELPNAKGSPNDKDAKYAGKSEKTSPTEANKEAKKAEKTRQKLEAKVSASDKKAIDKEEKLRQKSTAKHDAAGTKDTDKEEKRKQKLAAKEAVEDENRRLKLAAKDAAKVEKLERKIAEKEEKSKLRAAAKEVSKEEKLKQTIAEKEE